MDQPTALIVMIVCASLLVLIVTWVILYWIIRSAIGAALAHHREALVRERSTP